MNIPTVTPNGLSELCKNGKSIDLIDVRTAPEYGEVHVPVARNIPLDQLDPAAIMQARNGSQAEPLYLICKTGTRAVMAGAKFVQAGFNNVILVEGGTQAWADSGLPVIRGKKAMSLERQVRIVAGSIVLIGAGLGYFVHPAFIGLSAFIGAGLVFAGITDTCGMGMMLSKMPWNRARTTPAQCSTARPA
jgi:rhodanese-related sulfurtransferase